MTPFEALLPILVTPPLTEAGFNRFEPPLVVLVRLCRLKSVMFSIGF